MDDFISLVGILSLGIYSLYSNGLVNTAYYAAVLSVPFPFLFAIALEPNLFDCNLPPGKLFKAFFIRILILVLVSPLFGLLVYGMWTIARDLINLLRSLPRGPQAAGMGVIVVLCLGAFLFAVRLRYRATYGLSEVVVGLVIAAYRFEANISGAKPISPDFLVAILTAAVYLVVRGFDNIHQGIAKEPVDPLYQRLASRLRAAERSDTSQDGPLKPLNREDS
jgi:hypothetical protein